MTDKQRTANQHNSEHGSTVNSYMNYKSNVSAYIVNNSNWNLKANDMLIDLLGYFKLKPNLDETEQQICDNIKRLVKEFKNNNGEY